MKIFVQYKVIEKNSKRILSTVNTGYDLSGETKCEELKKIISESIPMLSHFEIDSQSMKLGGTYINDSEIITNKSGYKTEIIVREKGSKDDEYSTTLLGRKYIKDDRDKNFLIENLLPKKAVKVSTSRYWDDNGWWGNQGRTPQCVGYAWAHWIDDGPIAHNLPHPNINPTLIYTEAQKVDEWIGENYDGTSVRGAAKYLKAQNKISAYYWAYDVNTLVKTVLDLGPVVVGTNWYYNMFYPDRNGLIKATGYLAGGHAYVINGVDTVKKQFRIKNSWGKTWGQQGHAYISFTDMSKLIKEYGEICLATEVSF